jgi:hypothetical protein
MRHRLSPDLSLVWDKNCLRVEDQGRMVRKLLPSRVRDLKNFVNECLAQGRYEGWGWFTGKNDDRAAMSNACLYAGMPIPGDGLMNVGRLQGEELVTGAGLPLRRSDLGPVMAGAGCLRIDHPLRGPHWVFVFRDTDLYVVNSLLDVPCAIWDPSALESLALDEDCWRLADV